MRLIDADKLKAQFSEPADWLDINQTLVHKTGIWAGIDAAETVEAIPVDWIESYLSDCAEWSIAYYVIKQMLYKWREEREGE